MSLFDPIQPLKLSDTFYNWWETTNDISAALNPLNIYDVSAGPGISVSRITGGIAVLSVNVGCGLRHDANVSLTLDIENLPEKTLPDEADNYIIELANSTNVTPSSTDCETFRRVEATNILPYTVSGDHDFVGGSGSSIDISTTNFTVDSSNTHLKASSIKIGNVPSTLRSNISSIGFRIDALDEDPSLVYRGDLLAWYTNQNIGISYDQSFVSDGPSGSTTAKFNFSPRGATQTNTELNLLLGTRSSEIITTDIDEAITIRAIDSINAFDVSFTNTAGARIPLFYSKYDGGVVLFNISGRVYIEDIQNSLQFLTSSDYTEYRVPLTNTNGVVDYKFTNRFVSASFESSIIAGDVVRWNGSQFVKSQANTESNSQVFGVVEVKRSGKIYIALTGVFEGTGYVAGSTYYLSQTLAGKLTTTQPTSGIVKPIFVGISTTTALLNSSTTGSTPSFSNVQIQGGALVDADSVGDTLTLIPGSNITIEKNTNNEIEISAASLSQADYFKTAIAGVGTFDAVGEDTISFIGLNGILTLAQGSNNTVYISGPDCYSRIQVLGQNTGELDYVAEAQQSGDTLYIRSGIGINIISDSNNDILIEATGLSVPADGSITNNKLDDMVPFSIKGAQGNGRPVDIYDATNRLTNSVFGYDVSGGGEPISDPQVYTDTAPPYTVYESIVSLSGNSILAWAPHEDIAGYVFGRWTSDTGTVSGITALGRTELRRIIGASPTGFLEENANLFNAWYLYDSTGAEKATQTASDKSGELVFLEGNNITLTKTTTGTPDNKICIKIDAASSLSGFNNIINNRTGENIQSGDTGGVLELSDNDAIAIGVDSNNGLTFSIKPESITNEMLANMPFNSVKVSIYDTDNPNPIDLQIGQNQVLGRTTGNLKSLTSTELKQILGLTSSNYFNTFTTKNSVGTVTNTITASASETFSLQEGNNITLTRVTGENTFIVSAVSGQSGGLTRISVDDITPSFTAIASTLTFGLTNLVDPFTGSNYFNLDYSPINNSGDIRLEIDLGLMPEKTVKISGPDLTNRNGRTGHLACNLPLTANQLLYNDPLENNLVGKTLSEIAATTGGISYFRTISNGTNSTTMSGNGAHVLSLVPGNRITVTPSYIGASGTAQFTISSTTVVSSDTAPSLGGDLDVNTRSFTISAAKVLDFTQGGSVGQSRHLRIGATNTSGIPSISAIDSTNANLSVDILLSPQRSGKVVIGGTTHTIKTNTTSALNLECVDTVATSNHIVFQSGATSNVNISASVNKNLTIVSNGTGDIRIRGGSNEIISRFSGNNSALITNNTSGNLILVAGSALTGIPTAGSGSVQFNSDILLSAKSIKAVDNNINIDTVTNDFSGSLKLKSTNKSGYWRIKNGSITQTAGIVPSGTLGMSGGYLDAISSTTLEKSNKYIMYIQNNANPVDCAMVEFNVVVNGTGSTAFRSMEIINTMVSNVGQLYEVSEEGGGSGIIILQGEGGTESTGGNGGIFSLNPSICASAASGPSNSIIITLANCLIGTYNITLHKMSIEA